MCKVALAEHIYIEVLNTFIPALSAFPIRRRSSIRPLEVPHLDHCLPAFARQGDISHFYG